MAPANTAETKDLGPLPEWDLGDLYAGPESPELKSDLDRSATAAEGFRDHYRGKLAALSGDELAAAIAAYERLQDTLGRAMSYASLYYAADMSDPESGRFYQNMHERVNAIATELLFFTLELNRIEDAALDEKLKAPELAHYAPWLRDVRAFRPHQLSDEIEKLLHEKSVAGRAAWHAAVRRDRGGAALSRRRQGTDQRRGAASPVRPGCRDAQGAAKSLGEVFGENVRLFAHVTNTLAKDKEIEDRWRGFKRPISSRNLANFVEDEVVDALIAAVRASFRALSHRYYRLKAKWFGVERLPYWDRNAPLARGRRPAGALARGASASCSTPTARSRRTWRRSASASSTTAGSTRRRGRARRRAPSPIRPCRARIPISCSIIWAAPAT